MTFLGPQSLAFPSLSLIYIDANEKQDYYYLADYDLAFIEEFQVQGF